MTALHYKRETAVFGGHHLAQDTWYNQGHRQGSSNQCVGHNECLSSPGLSVFIPKMGVLDFVVSSRLWAIIQVGTVCKNKLFPELIESSISKLPSRASQCFGKTVPGHSLILNLASHKLDPREAGNWAIPTGGKH